MKPNELMIGDYVEHIQGSAPIQIEEIHTDGVIFSNVCYLPYEEIKPIPLTEEVLENNGWERVGDSRTYIDGQKCVLGNYRDFKWRMAYGGLNDDYTRIPSIRFVHQLQQALRLCEISKTIEL